MPEELLDLFPVSGDWVAVFLLEPGTVGALDDDPYRVETIAAWAYLSTPAGPGLWPVIGGECLEWTDEAIGVYRRDDLNRPDVRARIRTLCDMARDVHARAMGAQS